MAAAALDTRYLLPPSLPVQKWVSIKSSVVEFAGLDSGAAHVLASFVALVVLALLLRKPLSSFLPFVGVLLLEIANEAATGFADGELEEWELAGSMQDVPLVMALPLLVLLTLRVAPQLGGRCYAKLQPMPLQKNRDEIIDAEFEELE